MEEHKDDEKGGGKKMRLKTLGQGRGRGEGGTVGGCMEDEEQEDLDGEEENEFRGDITGGEWRVGRKERIEEKKEKRILRKGGLKYSRR